MNSKYFKDVVNEADMYREELRRIQELLQTDSQNMELHHKKGNSISTIQEDFLHSGDVFTTEEQSNLDKAGR